MFDQLWAGSQDDSSSYVDARVRFDIGAGTVVYFELRHWKAKEKKWSTLGWTYMHKEGFLKIVDGEPKVRTEAQGLHLYEKPLDFRSHFRQASMRKMKPLAEVPDLFLRFSEAQR